jgi:peptide-methionine (S)-S-oxide reductase
MNEREGKQMNAPGNLQVATLAGGCFWCLEAVYESLRGVERVESGYSGGTVVDPSYREVCTGTTGHAEVVQIAFDPSVISYHEILDVFFSIHDPTTLNRQGPDVGTQYRSAIFYHTEEQKAVAEQMIDELDASGAWKDPIVTEVAPFAGFYPAEDYHREYYRRNRTQPYCRVVIAPKMEKFVKLFPDRIKV